MNSSFDFLPCPLGWSDANTLQRQGISTGAIEAKLDKLLELRYQSRYSTDLCFIRLTNKYSLSNNSKLDRFTLPTNTAALNSSSYDKQPQPAPQVGLQPSRFVATWFPEEFMLILLIRSPTSHDDYTRLYQKWCHNQPLYLFQQRDFLQTFPSRDKELRLAVQVLGSRFLDSTSSDIQNKILEMMQTCRCLVTGRVSAGKVRLSTLQTLCLLSQISFSGKWQWLIYVTNPNSKHNMLTLRQMAIQCKRV